MADKVSGPCELRDQQCKLSNLNELLRLFQIELERIRSAPKSKDVWERSQIVATIVASLFIPVALLIVGQQHTAATAETALRVAHANLLRESIAELTSHDPARQSLAVISIRTALGRWWITRPAAT